MPTSYSDQWTVHDSANKLTLDMDVLRDVAIGRMSVIKAAAPKLGRTSNASISLRTGPTSVELALLITSNGNISAIVETPEDGEDAAPGLLP